MTGRLAARHGVYQVGGRLPESFTTLPELLSAYGFTTGGFVSNPVVDKLKSNPAKTAGFDQGFDVFEGLRDEPTGPDANSIPRTVCKPLIQRALDFVDRHQDDRFFLWMLHLDPHAPYAPPAPYDTMYLDHPVLAARNVTLDPDEIHAQAYVSSRLESREYIARHLGEVTQTDHWLGVLLRRIEALPGRTLLVITADHGESLGDVGYWFGHGGNIRHPCVNVPLIIACDGVVPIGTSDALVANTDLAPTILELLGIPSAALVANGVSLSPTFNRPDPWRDRMIPLQVYEGVRWRGVRSADYCLQSQFNPTDGRRLRTLLYDLRTDPLEQTDVSAGLPDVVRRHRQLEQDWFSQGGRVQDFELINDPEMIRRLRSLGYVQ
jgi:arylsulfatase A-like enzyme